MKCRLRAISMVILLAGAWIPSAYGQQPGVAAPEDVIAFALYTVHDNTLKLTAQLHPLPDDADRVLTLEIRQGGRWTPIAAAQVIEAGWTAPFRVENWDDTQKVSYRVNHMDRALYTGTIQKNPRDKKVMTVAVFTCNSVQPRDGGDIPKTDLVNNVKRLNPDLVFFSGDQVYNHTQHYRYWMKFGEDFGDILRDYPSICIPDDHDVGHANLWGAGGKKSEVSQGHDGGYFMPVEYVNEVQRAQTSHLPDPFDPTPIERGITVYYTDLTWGGVSFAILEDRKWKSGPSGLVPQMGPRPDHVSTPDYDPKDLDVPGAVLLGDRQLAFLRHWTTDWKDADMKAVLHQSIFSGGAHRHGKYDNRLYADLDSNGWPQSGRNRALSEIRKSFSVMLAGDQHLGTVIRHGIDDWNDAGYSFCVPAIANLYLRWWEPVNAGRNRVLGSPWYTGEHLDGFGNKLTMIAAANPAQEPKKDDLLTTKAAGFGVVRFNKPKREITFECWPRNVKVGRRSGNQYDGWPVTIHQSDNYGAEIFGYLPTIEVKGLPNPVIQVIDEASGEIVYAYRAHGKKVSPFVFHDGIYTLIVGNGSRPERLTGLKPEPNENADVITIALSP